MRPLETNVELSSHLWMYNRLRELLIREGLLAAQASEPETKMAVEEWLRMVSRAKGEASALPH